MSRLHIRLRLARLRRAPWWCLAQVTRQGFVFNGVGRFEALSWTGFYVCRGADTAEQAAAHLALNREVVRRLRARRGRRC